MHTATASAAFINHVLDVAVRHGCDSDALLRQVALDRALLADPVRRIGFSYLRALYAAAAQASGLPHFGLLVGAGVRPGSYGGLGYVAMTSATLGEATAMIRRFGKIVFDSPSSQTRTTVTDGLLTIEDHRITEREPYCISHTEAVLAGWTAFGRWLLGRNSALTAVHMMHAAPANPELYASFFGCPVQYGSHMNALVLPAALLEEPVLGADPRTHQRMVHEAELQLGRSYAPFSVIRRLRALMVEQMAGGELRLEVLARQLAMSPRTLQRKLAAEDLSFSGMLESVRLELAEQYLSRSALRITEIALALGFSQTSAFSHAFRQARGMSPADFRRRSQEQDDR